MSKKLTTEEFIEKAKQIHGDKYDYSKVEYKNCEEKVCIICPIHGEFLQTPNSHLNGNGCSKCAKCYHYTTEDFIDKAKQIHNNKYDYSKSIYNGIFKKICIVCPEHGEFWQTPKNHLKGSGCPKCAKSHLENEVELFLKNNKIEFECQKKFEWLGKQSLDFYLPHYNIAVECQGEQHFKSIDYFGGLNEYKQTVDRDNLKKKLCEENGVRLLYFSNLGIEYPYQVFEDKDELLKEIN